MTAQEALDIWIPRLNLVIYNFCEARQKTKGFIQARLTDYENTQKFDIDKTIEEKKGNFNEFNLLHFKFLTDHDYDNNMFKIKTDKAANSGFLKYAHCKAYMENRIYGEFNIDTLYELCKARAEDLREELRKEGVYMEGDNFFYDPTPEKEYVPGETFVYDPWRNYKQILIDWEHRGVYSKEHAFKIDNTEYDTEHLQPFITKRYFYHVIACLERIRSTFGTTFIDGARFQDRSFENEHGCFVAADGSLMEEDLTTMWPTYDFHGYF